MACTEVWPLSRHIQNILLCIGQRKLRPKSDKKLKIIQRNNQIFPIVLPFSLLSLICPSSRTFFLHFPRGDLPIVLG